MNVKRYFAKTAREALRALKDELGVNAIVLSNRAVEGGVEILALPAEVVGAMQAPTPPAAPASFSASLAQRSPEPEGALDEEDFRVSLRRARGQVAPAEPMGRPAEIRPFEPPRVASQMAAYRSGASSVRAPAPEPAVAPARPRSAPVAEAPAEPRRAPPPPVQEPVRSSAEELARIKALEASNGQLMNEIAAIRALLERQLAGFAWGETSRQAPARADVLAELLENGFSAALARRLVQEIDAEASPAEGRAVVGSALDRQLRVLDSDSDIIDRGGVYALVGPTGVGKTTTTAKLAARCVVRHGASKLALITTDGYRIGAHEQLRIYGRILGVPVFAVRDAADLRQTLAELKGKHMVLIDTVGVSQRDRMVAEQAAMLLGAGEVRRLLLLNATSRGDTLDDVIRAYRGADMAGCILTKVDEAASLAPVVDAVVRHELDLFYVANGQRVPEDLHLPNRAYLLHRALREQPEESAHRLSAEEAGLMLTGSGRG